MQTVTTADGRTLEVFASGDPDALALVFHVGTPAAGAPFPLLTQAAAEAGLRPIIYSRPGYGRSTRLPGRRAASSAEDTRAVLDALGADEFITIGWSGGGPHALACGALLPNRCLAVATLGGVAPHADGFDWSAGMGRANLEAFALVVEGGADYERLLEQSAATLRNIRGDQLAEQFASLLSAPDRHALEGPIAEFIALGYRRAFMQGTGGWYDDEATMLRLGWGFNLAEVTVPVSVWQGRHDLMTPPAHAQWLSEHLPDAQLHVLENEGHVSLVANRLNRILDSVNPPVTPQA